MQYDNTNTAAFFSAPENQRLVRGGRMNISGTDTNALMVETVTKTGKTVHEIYVKVGAVFPSKSQHEKAPALTGPLTLSAADVNSISLWKREDKNGRQYLSGKLEHREQQGGYAPSPGYSAPSSSNHDDEIPF